MTRFRSTAVQTWILMFVFTTAWADFDVKVVNGRGKQTDIEAAVTDISSARVVFIGESHDRYDQHLSELEIIRRLYEQDPNRWTIGVEFIQRPFQSDLDAYIAGDISEREFLRSTEYFDRWGYDFRLYSPIFRFAKEHAIPMVALNADRELTERVGKVGLEGLSSRERERLPGQIDKSDQSYRKRLQKIFGEHTQASGGNFEHFWEAQLVWDETMAERVTDYLSNHPDKAMVVLAGDGHIEFGSGIPNRVRRRLPQVKVAVLLTNDKPETKSHLTDYSLVSKKKDLPPAPRIGIVMEVSDGVRVKNVTPGGPAENSGIKPKDRIVAIDDEKVTSTGVVSLALLDKKTGDPVVVRVQRSGAAGEEDLVFQMRVQ